VPQAGRRIETTLVKPASELPPVVTRRAADFGAAANGTTAAVRHPGRHAPATAPAAAAAAAAAAANALVLTVRGDSWIEVRPLKGASP
jgi:cytoskeletal protein RodZ